MGFREGPLEGVVEFREGPVEGLVIGFREGPVEGVVMGFIGGPVEGEVVGTLSIIGQPIKAPNCTSNPVGLMIKAPSILLTVKVMVVMAPRPVAMKEDNPPKLSPPNLLKDVIVVDEVPSDTTTETRVLSTAK